MKKFENLGRSLSKTEQKQIIGGDDLRWDGSSDPNGRAASCSCTHMVGTWVYTSTPSCGEVIQDMYTYCRGGAHCSGTCSM